MVDYTIPSSTAIKFQDMLVQKHIVDLMVKSPYVHVWLYDGHMYCQTEEPLDKNSSIFNVIIKYFEEKNE